MSSAAKVNVMFIMVVALVAPVALLEISAVARFGFAEPYGFFLSIPLAIVSFLLLQFAIGYGVVKGWRSAECRVITVYWGCG